MPHPYAVVYKESAKEDLVRHVDRAHWPGIKTSIENWLLGVEDPVLTGRKMRDPSALNRVFLVLVAPNYRVYYEVDEGRHEVTVWAISNPGGPDSTDTR